jgi:hypothetical protein
MSELIERILRETHSPELLEILGESLNPTDLQSLLLEVYRRRAGHLTPADLLAQYEHNRFVRPSTVDPAMLMELDRLAFSLAVPTFQPIELAPVCPLGTTSVISSVDQNSTVATIRNTELVSDSTNVMALECALRRRELLKSQDNTRQPVKLCASQRVVRAQNFNRPDMVAHFRLFALCSAGRAKGSLQFEFASLVEHLQFYIRFLSSLAETGYSLVDVRFTLTDLDNGVNHESLRTSVIEPLAANFPGVIFALDPDRQAGRGYYEKFCFGIYARDAQGIDHNLVDGGFTNWTQQLLSNAKERLLISGIGIERLGSLYYNKTG